jgi:hypothetical protein
MSSTPELQVLPEVRPNRRATRNRVYCELDRWSFDPRYTGGACPICGWVPDGVKAAPGWIALLRKLDWAILGLLLLVIGLVVLGAVVAYASGLMPALKLR